MCPGCESEVLPYGNRAYYEAHHERAVEEPAPVLVAKSSQQQEEKDEMEPGPHPAHPLEVPEETVRGRRRKECRDRCGGEKRHQRPENRLTTQVERFSPEGNRQNEGSGSSFNDDAKEDVPRSHVRKEKVVPDDEWNQQRYEQQRDDRRAPGELG